MSNSMYQSKNDCEYWYLDNSSLLTIFICVCIKNLSDRFNALQLICTCNSKPFITLDVIEKSILLFARVGR